MRAELLEWIRSNLGKILQSPREKEFKRGRSPQNFKIVKLDEEGKRIVVQFMGSPSRTLLPLEFWRFDKVLDLISKGEWVRLGTRLFAEDPSTIEWKLQEHAKKLYGRKTDYKTAPHICDILVQSGIAKYGYAKNPYTKRQNQAIKLVKQSEGSVAFTSGE